jgi:tRNA pseudouridine32 synthase/23S rRNA pseudouridine746 synthase/23S rRNA pseudouridine955/2504/2580 synthase
MIRILHEDAGLLVLDKPAGQLTIPGRQPEARPSLNEEAETTLGCRLWIVHRIDRETSGLVIFAKDATTHRALCMQFEKRTVDKRYLALVRGRIEEAGEITRPIRECGSGRSAVADRGGKTARTLFTPLEQFPEATLLEVRIETGRRHQIRVHLYALGHPLIGDPLYGADRPVGGGSRLMLHAHSLTLEAGDSSRLSLACLPGADWAAELKRWQRTALQ